MMDDLDWIEWAVQSELLSAPVTLVWAVALILGVVLLGKSRAAGGLLIGASLLYGLNIVLGVMSHWAFWRTSMGGDESILAPVLSGIMFISSLLSHGMLIAAVWVGRSPTNNERPPPGSTY